MNQERNARGTLRWVAVAVLLAIGGPIACLVLFTVSYYGIESFLPARLCSRRIDVYETMSFEVYDGKITTLWSDEDMHRSLAPIWLRIAGLGVVFLPDATDEQLAKLGEFERRPLSGDRGEICYSDNRNDFITRNGHLVYVSLDNPGDRIQIGLQKEGPFYSLPLDEQTAKDLFGKPLRHGKPARPPW
jgi:hypothetical protein